MTDYTYNTGNPIGSTDVRDGVDNLKSFDVLLNSTDDTYQDRLGNTVPTAAGAIKRLGHVVVGWTFTTGGTLNYPNEAALNPADGNYYGWNGALPKVVAPGTDPTLPGSGYVQRTDVLLRNQLTGGGSLASPYGVINVDLPPYSGDLSAAIDAAPAGSTLCLGNRDYNIVGKFSLSAFLTKQLKFRGAGMPILAADKSRFITGTGTIIHGSLVSVVDGFQCFDVGIDVGPYVVDNLAGGVYQEGLVVANEIHNDPFNFSKYSKDCHIGNIRVLLKDATSDPSTAKHGVLLENLYGGSHGYVECIGGYHGFVYKSYGVQPKGPVVAYGQQGEAAIFKSDSNSLCGNYRNGNLILGREGWTTQVGWITQAGVGSAWVNISFHVSLLNIANRGHLNVMDSATAYCSDFTLLSLQSDGCAGVTMEVPQNAINWRIGPHSIANTTYGIGVVAGAIKISIDDGSVTNASQHSYVFHADLRHGKLLSVNSGVNDVLTSVSIDRNAISATNVLNAQISPKISSTYTAKPSVIMEAGWSNYGMTADKTNSTFSIGGYVSGGTNDRIATITNGNLWPKTRIDYVFAAEDIGGTRSVITGYITPSGEIYAVGGGTIGSSGGKVFLDGLSWLFA